MARLGGLRLFEGYGIELEYVIVRKDTLDILPISDEVIRAARGNYANDVVTNGMGWSNEFVLHVIEMQNLEPSASLAGLAGMYHSEVERINRILESMDGMLMPSSMHPWMDPVHETRLWSRRHRRIYETYDRIFNCSAHGWSNIQSAQMNMSFSGDDEFRRLHSAIRLVLPLVPAIAASSPIFGSRANGILDNRILFYRKNQLKVPSITGSNIPEHVSTMAEYRQRILERMYAEIAPYDEEGMLRHEWLNSRGAIPRFERSSIEIRLADIQECPAADMAVMWAIDAAIKAHVTEKWISLDEQASCGTESLAAILEETARQGENSVISDIFFLQAFGVDGPRATAGGIWQHIIDTAERGAEEFKSTLDVIKTKGTLSSRILRAVGRNPDTDRIRHIYRMLCRCLSRGESFIG
jgi:gamma-glutamyl:cysteine ligase YbdK (ATP-grasp superfamily)